MTTAARRICSDPLTNNNVVMPKNCQIIFVVLLLITIAPIHGGRVTFWSDTNFQGMEYHINMRPGQCYRLGVSDDRLSSFSTYGQCVDLYTRSDCFGGMFRSEAQSTDCHRNLGDCDINDRISSVRLCPRCRYSCYGPHNLDGADELDETEMAQLELSESNTCRCQCNCAGLCMSPDYQY